MQIINNDDILCNWIIHYTDKNGYKKTSKLYNVCKKDVFKKAKSIFHNVDVVAKIEI